MSVDCKDELYYKCPDWDKVETDTAGKDHTEVSHKIDHNVKLDLGFATLYAIKTLRTFSLSGKHSYDKDIYHVVGAECIGLSVPPCYSWCYDRTDIYSSYVSENCKIEKDTIYYLDLGRQIVFYKHEEEELKFKATSSETSVMKQKFGNSVHYKLKIKDAKIKCKEQFILYMDGKQTILKEFEYKKEPQWEMGPIGLPTTNNTIVVADTETCDKYDKDIQQILLWPMPPSKATPMDFEVRCLGFYDYGNSDPMTENPLIEKDGGGKDFFYPSWCRGMLEDSLWRRAADSRYAMTWLHIPPTGTTDYYGESIVYDAVPKGNAVFHAKLGSMYSFVFRNHEGKEFVVSNLDGNNPSEKITILQVTDTGSDWAYHPISIL